MWSPEAAQKSHSVHLPHSRPNLALGSSADAPGPLRASQRGILKIVVGSLGKAWDRVPWCLRSSDRDEFRVAQSIFALLSRDSQSMRAALQGKRWEATRADVLPSCMEDPVKGNGVATAKGDATWSLENCPSKMAPSTQPQREKRKRRLRSKLQPPLLPPTFLR
jgi:hypothetical protein